MTDDDGEETFELALIKEVLGVRESAVLEWASAFKLTTMACSVSSRQAAILGAVLTMKKHSPGKAGELRPLLLQLLAYDGPDDDWVVVRRVRSKPQIERPPVRVDVTSSLKARPVIYDPMTFLDQLRQLSS